jgi:hypothetical protein
MPSSRIISDCPEWSWGIATSILKVFLDGKETLLPFYETIETSAEDHRYEDELGEAIDAYLMDDEDLQIGQVPSKEGTQEGENEDNHEEILSVISVPVFEPQSREKEDEHDPDETEMCKRYPEEGTVFTMSDLTAVNPFSHRTGQRTGIVVIVDKITSNEDPEN